MSLITSINHLIAILCIIASACNKLSERLHFLIDCCIVLEANRGKWICGFGLLIVRWWHEQARNLWNHYFVQFCKIESVCLLLLCVRRTYLTKVTNKSNYTTSSVQLVNLGLFVFACFFVDVWILVWHYQLGSTNGKSRDIQARNYTFKSLKMDPFFQTVSCMAVKFTNLTACCLQISFAKEVVLNLLV